MKGIMKKLLAFTMVLAMLVTVTACGDKEASQEDILAKLNAALQNTNEAGEKEADMSANFDFAVNLNGQDQNVVGDCDLKTKVGDESKLETIQLAMPMNVKLGESNIALKVYAKDGWVYTALMGMKSKTPLDKAGFDEAMKNFQKQKKIEIKMDYLKSIKEEEDKIIAELDVPAIVEAFDKAQEGEDAEALDSERLAEVEKAIKKAELTFTLAEEKIKAIRLDVDVDQPSDKPDQAVKVKGFIEMKYNKIGDIGEIEFPNDLNTYMESSDFSVTTP